jgi:1,4-alpha-glucan branching enzyme
MDQEMYWHMAVDDDNAIIDRGIALHKIIRLFTQVSGGDGWLNFMGNEFGHPEWLAFPREGNDWSYHYCRRQWSLVDNPDLRYKYMNAFDVSMIHLVEKHKILACAPAQQLYVHNDDQILAAERGNLIFVFNLSPQQSFPDYLIPVIQQGNYRVVLNSDSSENGGHQRIDESIIHSTNEHHQLSLYLPSRTCMVLEKQ